MQTFETPQPVVLTVRTAGGTVSVVATDEPTSSVTLTPLNDAGADAVERARVEHHGVHLLVDLPRKGLGLLRTRPEVAVEVRVPSDSTLDLTAESADIVLSGRCADAACVTGSGSVALEHVAGHADLVSGSGRMSVGTVGDRLTVKTGSGDVDVDRTGRQTRIGLGSGDVSLGEAVGQVVVKTGSGDLEVGVLDGEVVSKTGSGDLTVRRAVSGSLRSTGASGDITVGVVEGTAAWLDLSTVSGRVSQDLPDSAGPREGQARVTITASTVSGDVRVARS